MIEVVDFTVPYAPVSGIRSLSIIMEIVSSEGLIIFVLDIYNAFQNTILSNHSEIVYLSLPYTYLNWHKKMAKIPIILLNK